MDNETNKLISQIRLLVSGWRAYAAGSYCRAYNGEYGNGLRNCANQLEDTIDAFVSKQEENNAAPADTSR